ncbi:MAG: TRAP transporter small permease [Chloroflexi bacterium]|nr:TRAP transporter small permease [Chloroflexota bacterium]
MTGASAVDRGRAALHRIEDVVGVTLFGALVVIVLFQVVVRFLFYLWLQIAWTDEIGRALLVWISFWGALLVQRDNNHITIDVLYDRLPPGLQMLLRIFSDVLIAAFLVTLVRVALPIFLESFIRPAPATGLPSAIYDGPLWITSVLMLVHIALNARERWRREAAPASIRP